jgi:hypothetical protein
MPVAVVNGSSAWLITFRLRSSSGSMPRCRATTSTICSRATVSIIHGPRYAHRPQVVV